ncbi:phage capsid protein, partial [Xylella fastidiosa subsp. multiplex]|nr:phage capsid protein [Xylella fastidiosa subsp. multiplex]
QTGKVIGSEGLLTGDVLIYDIEDAMNHYDVRAEYTAQLGESLAMAADGAVLAELAGLVNLPDGSNEDIEGLGKPTVLTLVKPTTGSLTDPVELGKAI